MVRFGAKRRNLFLLFIFTILIIKNSTLSIKTSFKRQTNATTLGKSTFTKPEHN
jgi:hypothetical protein